MRSSFMLGLAFALAACGGSSNKPLDMTSGDQSVPPDQSVAAVDMTKIVTPYNMPGSVYCYSSTACTTPGGSSVCCDAAGDGGFTDTCVATIAACTTGDPSAHAYQCGQAADCGSGMVCCGTVATSASGSMHFSGTGTTCAASCAAGDTQLCVSNTECATSGTTCVGKEVSGRDVGLCQ
jgi:hypothetical protein